MEKSRFDFKRFIISACNFKHFKFTNIITNKPISINYVECFFSNIDNSKTKVIVTTTYLEIGYDCNYLIILKNGEILIRRVVVSAIKHII